MGRARDKADLIRGALDMLVLKTLEAGALHGYAIARRIREAGSERPRAEG